MKIEIRSVVAYGGERLTRWGKYGNFLVMGMSYILIAGVVIWVYIFVKTHQIIHLESVQYTADKFKLKKKKDDLFWRLGFRKCRVNSGETVRRLFCRRGGRWWHLEYSSGRGVEEK